MSDGIRFPRRMGPVDAMFWQLERERTLRSTTVAVAVLDAAPEREALRRSLRRVCRRIPRLRQRVIELPAALSTPVWSPDPDFELDYHLRWIGAPSDAAPQYLLDLAASMAMQAFDRSRPLWEFVVVEGLEEGRAALIQKLHHSVGDGAAGLTLMGELYDFDRDASQRGEEPELEAPIEPEQGALALTAEALRTEIAEWPRSALRLLAAGIASLRDPLESARRFAAELTAVAGIMRSGPGPLSPIMGERSSRHRYAGFIVQNAGLKAAAQSQGCTFNSALLAAVVGGLARYHDRRGARVEALRAAMPISVRSADEVVATGNRLAIARFSVATTTLDPGTRMREIQARVAEQREPASLGAFEVIANMVNVGPSSFLLPLVLEEMRKSDFVATSMPGPPTPFYLAGSRVESLFAFGPTAGAALNVTLLGYTDQASVGITLDPAAIPDSGLLVDCLRQGFEEVLKLA